MVTIEYIQSEGGYCVIFIPYENAPEEEQMILHKFKTIEAAEVYLKNFNETLKSFLSVL
jgi:hypothetical protein